MRKKVKIVKLAAGSSKQVLEDQMNAQLTKGWAYVGVFTFESSTYFVFEKNVVN